MKLEKTIFVFLTFIFSTSTSRVASQTSLTHNKDSDEEDFNRLSLDNKINSKLLKKNEGLLKQVLKKMKFYLSIYLKTTPKVSSASIFFYF
jgi:hypothetical protein